MTIKTGFLVVMACSAAGIQAEAPAFLISSSFIQPRLSMISDQESAHWQTLVAYQQDLSPRIQIETQFEVGSSHYMLENPFRLHQLRAGLQLGSQHLALGRLPYWTSVVQVRIDGLEYTLELPRLGRLTGLAGVKASTDFSASAAMEKKFMLMAWEWRRSTLNLMVTYWIDKSPLVEGAYTGLQLNQKLGKSGRLVAAAAYALNSNRLDYYRVQITKSLRDHQLTLGVRQRRLYAQNLYPWLENTTAQPAPALTAGILSRLSPHLTWQNQLVHKFLAGGRDYLKTSFHYRRYAIGVMLNLEDNRRQLGGIISTRQTLGKFLKLGGSLAWNAYDYENLEDKQTTLGAYGWVGWSPTPRMDLRFFTRYYQNPYYAVDGRAGVAIHVAL